MKRLIYAEDAMQNVLDEIRYKDSLYTSTAWHIAKKAIDAAPTIEPKRIKSEWVYAGEDVCNTYYECPVCESVFASCNHFKYCPECGTRMVSANE